MVNTFDPEKHSNFILNDVLAALSAGLAIICLPEVSAPLLGIDAGAQVVGRVLVNSLEQAPGIARTIWPSGTTDSKLIQIGDLESELAAATGQMTDNFNAALQMLMSDVPSSSALLHLERFRGLNLTAYLLLWLVLT